MPYLEILLGSGEILLIELIILSFPPRIIIVSYLAEYQTGREEYLTRLDAGLLAGKLNQNANFAKISTKTEWSGSRARVNLSLKTV